MQTVSRRWERWCHGSPRTSRSCGGAWRKGLRRRGDEVSETEGVNLAGRNKRGWEERGVSRRRRGEAGVRSACLDAPQEGCVFRVAGAGTQGWDTWCHACIVSHVRSISTRSCLTRGARHCATVCDKPCQAAAGFSGGPSSGGSAPWSRVPSSHAPGLPALTAAHSLCGSPLPTRSGGLLPCLLVA